MAETLTFFLREAQSDVAGATVLGREASALAPRLTASVPAGASGEQAFHFVSPPALPNRVSWAAGSTTAVFNVVSDGDGNLTYRIRLYRTDQAGGSPAAFGSLPALQSGIGQKTFVVALAAALSGAESDRFRVTVEVDNADGASARAFEISVGIDSSVRTPVPTKIAAAKNRRRRGDFLRRGRPGERAVPREVSLGAPNVEWEEIWSTG